MCRLAKIMGLEGMRNNRCLILSIMLTSDICKLKAQRKTTDTLGHVTLLLVVFMQQEGPSIEVYVFGNGFSTIREDSGQCVTMRHFHK